MRWLPPVLASLLFAVLPAAAQHQVFHADAVASQIHITLGGTAHTTHGIFHVQSGAIEFDPTAGTISGLVIVDAGSGDTGNDSRDRKMKAEVLEAPQFAQITFAPRAYQGTLRGTGDSTIQVSGVFTLHGTPHDLTAPAEVHLEGNASTVHARFAIPYVQWGLKNPSNLLLKVDRKVEVEVTLNGSLSPGR